MADETETTEVVEVAETVAVTSETADSVTSETADSVTEETTVMTAGPVVEESVEESIEVETRPAPRGPWDFTNSQRVILALLLWLNLMVLAIGILIVTGYLTI